MATSKAEASKQLRSVAQIETLITITCCGSWHAELSPSGELKAVDGGASLGKAACDQCGAEYEFGVIAKTRADSLASDTFEHVADAVLEEIVGEEGLANFDEEADELRMCAHCDGSAASKDLCRGCGEYVHVDGGCRTREPRNARRHAVEEHWAEPKTELAKAAAPVPGDLDDDGSRIDPDSDDFVAEV